MADTDRFDRLTDVVERTGSKLVVTSDAAQLPLIGAGGMFSRLALIAPSVELSNIRRTLDPAEQRAWADLRAGVQTARYKSPASTTASVKATG